MTHSSFPRSARLTRPGEFRRVFQRPIVSRDRYFRVLARDSGQRMSRLGLAISRKACSKASGRSRLKRLVRESFRLNRVRLDESVSLDLVVMAQRDAASATNQELTESLGRHWKTIASRCSEKDKET
ncbi:MAG: ribonuclease P protein component [Xanthomonadales bacterium]|nr:ribonuclease P protein component [Xanthomonadales bacterium]